MDASNKIVCHADVESAVLSARKNINVKLAIHADSVVVMDSGTRSLPLTRPE
jgi:hypothetical protein